MDRLSIVLTLITGSVLVGGFVIVILSLGYYDWRVIAGAVVVGFLLTWPAAYAISRWIKREDPVWEPPSGKPEGSRDDRTDLPEV